MVLALYVYFYQVLSKSFGIDVGYINSLTTIFVYIYIVDGIATTENILIWEHIGKLTKFYIKFLGIIALIDLSILPKYTKGVSNSSTHYVYVYEKLRFIKKIEMLIIFVVVTFLLELGIKYFLRRVYKKKSDNYRKGKNSKKGKG